LPTICKELQGQHDFSCFIHAKDRHRPGGDNVMTLNTCRFQLSGPTTDMDSDGEPDNDDDGTFGIVNCKFTFEAKGFRRSMVRNLVGFIVDVGRGLRNMDDFTAIWTGTDEAAKLVCSSPASGLCLAKVHYEPNYDT
jgi:tRNA pseudouridine38-40 synthase